MSPHFFKIFRFSKNFRSKGFIQKMWIHTILSTSAQFLAEKIYLTSNHHEPHGGIFLPDLGMLITNLKSRSAQQISIASTSASKFEKKFCSKGFNLLCCALFDIRFVIGILELTKRPGPVKKSHHEVRDGYL